MDSARQSTVPLVSIVTPSFNRRGFIEACLGSVANQEYANIEHIVVDGGSTDGTVELLESWTRTERLRWVSEPDSGMYHAINKGLQMAEGEYLGYLNTDDCYLPWSVSRAVEEMSQGTDVVFGDLIVVREANGVSHSYLQYYPQFDFRHYLWTQSIGQPTVFWRRCVTEAAGLFDTEHFKLLADCDRWLTFASQGFVPRHIDEALAIQIDHGKTLRETHPDRLAEEFCLIRKKYGGHGEGPSQFVSRLRQSARWRATNFRLLGALLSSHPSAWPRLTGFLKNEGIAYHNSYALLGLLPGPLRFGLGASLLDGRALVDAVSGERGRVIA